MEPQRVEPRSGFTGLGVIYGPPKVGKSTLVSSLVDATIDTENGLKMIPGILRYPVTTLSELKEACKDAKNRGFKRISVDTIDFVNRWVEKSVCDTLKIDVMGQGKYGTTYQMAQNRIIDILAYLRGQFELVLIVGHQKQAIVNEEATKSRMLQLPGQMSRIVCAEADFIAFCRIGENGKRIVDFKPYDGVDSGTRLPELADLTLEFSKSAEENRAIFDRLFTAKQEQ